MPAEVTSPVEGARNSVKTNAVPVQFVVELKKYAAPSCCCRYAGCAHKQLRRRALWNAVGVVGIVRVVGGEGGRNAARIHNAKAPQRTPQHTRYREIRSGSAASKPAGERYGMP